MTSRGFLGWGALGALLPEPAHPTRVANAADNAAPSSIQRREVVLVIPNSSLCLIVVRVFG
ncbi:hypothetical protein [Trueperella pyogenes]|uniref:hypothetical protein n=1 Tax=Trueperella pyogenes TaxID=1661 RepID=UPI003132D3FC